MEILGKVTYYFTQSIAEIIVIIISIIAPRGYFEWLSGEWLKREEDIYEEYRTVFKNNKKPDTNHSFRKQIRHEALAQNQKNIDVSFCSFIIFLFFSNFIRYGLMVDYLLILSFLGFIGLFIFLGSLTKFYKWATIDYWIRELNNISNTTKKKWWGKLYHSGNGRASIVRNIRDFGAVLTVIIRIVFLVFYKI